VPFGIAEIFKLNLVSNGPKLRKTLFQKKSYKAVCNPEMLPVHIPFNMKTFLKNRIPLCINDYYITVLRSRIIFMWLRPQLRLWAKVLTRLRQLQAGRQAFDIPSQLL
jgi:hypothetical protein